MISKTAYEQKRKFSAQIRVRFNTTTTRIELADATPFGGPTGTYRMRVDRRWCDAADGAPWFPWGGNRGADRGGKKKSRTFMRDYGLKAINRQAEWT